MSCRATAGASLWLLVQFAAWCWVEGTCSSAYDINTWQTSGICVRSHDDMKDCGSDISNVFVADEVRPARMANCLVVEKGWRLSAACMDCFGRLVDCIAEACSAACYHIASHIAVCRACVTHVCNKVGAPFHFSNCSGTALVDPHDFSNCTAPPTSIIPGLDDGVFFGIVGAGGVVVLAGMGLAYSRLRLGKEGSDSVAPHLSQAIVIAGDETSVRPGSLISGAKPQDNATELSSQFVPKGKERMRAIRGVL